MKKRVLFASLLSLAFLAGCGTKASNTEAPTTSEVSDTEAPVTSETPAATYLVSAAEGIKGGTIAFDKTSAKAGDTVTVTATADENKDLKQLTCEGLTFTTVEEGKTYTFTMPANDVTVGAEFVEYSIPVVKNISTNFLKVQDEDGAFTEKHHAGDTVYFEIVASGVDISTLTETHLFHIYVVVNDQIIHPTFAEGGSATGIVPVSFTMPDEATTVYVAYCVQFREGDETCANKVTLDLADGFKVIGVDPELTYKYLNPYLLVPDGYKITRFQWKYDSDTTEEGWTDVSYTLNNGVATFSIRPNYQNLAGDITIKVEGEYVGSQKISYSNASDVEFYEYSNYYYTSIEAPTSALIGDTVSFYAKCASTAHFTGESKVTVTGAEDTPTVSESGDYVYVSFVVGQSEVDVSFSTAANETITILDNANVKKAVVRNSYSYDAYEINSAAPGKYFYVYAKPVDGYKFIGAKLNGGEMVSSTSSWYDAEYDYYVPLVMPETGAAQIELVLSKVYTVTTTSTNATISVSSSSYGAGETVKFGASEDTGYKLEEVKVYKTGDPTTTVEFTYDESAYSYKYSFVMPEYSVTIEAVTSMLPATNTELDFSGITTSQVSDIMFYWNNARSSLEWDGNTNVPTTLNATLGGGDLTIQTILVDNANLISIDATVNGTVTTYEPTSKGYVEGAGVVAEFTVPVDENLTKLAFKLKANTPIATTITDSTGGKVTPTYIVNGKTVNSLATVYEGDNVRVVLNKTDSSDTGLYGLAYNGTALSLNKSYYSSDYYEFTVEKTCSLEFKALKSYTLIINNTSGYSPSIYASDWSTLQSGKTYTYAEGSNYFSIYCYGGQIDIEVLVGGVKDETLSKTGVYSWDGTINFTADVVINITATVTATE